MYSGRKFICIMQICSLVTTCIGQHLLPFLELYWTMCLAVVQEAGANAPPKIWICWKSGQILENPGKNGTQRCLTSKNCPPQCLQKYTWRSFSWRAHQKKVFNDLCGRQFVGKSRTKKLFGQVCGNSGKNPPQPANFACFYTYGVECGYWNIGTTNKWSK